MKAVSISSARKALRNEESRATEQIGRHPKVVSTLDAGERRKFTTNHLLLDVPGNVDE